MHYGYPGSTGLPAGVLVFQPDGNLVLYPKTGLYQLAAVQALLTKNQPQP